MIRNWIVRAVFFYLPAQIAHITLLNPWMGPPSLSVFECFIASKVESHPVSKLVVIKQAHGHILVRIYIFLTRAWHSSVTISPSSRRHESFELLSNVVHPLTRTTVCGRKERSSGL